MRRTWTTVAMVSAWLVILAAPAGAHSAEGEDASNFESRLLAVTPELSGVEVEVIENGNRMQVRNTSGDDLVVVGYQGEPYLRIGPDGVAENLRSPATYLNEDRQGSTAVPGSADPDAEPEWSPVSDATTARWHDHRVHWMGAENPPQVQQDPDRRHTVTPEWTVEMQVGDATVDATGDLVWVPGPSAVPWWALATVAFAVACAAAWFPWRRVLAAAVGLLVVADVVHALGVALARVDGLGGQLGQIVTGSVLSVAGWIAGAAAVVLLARGRETGRLDPGLLAAALAGLLIGVNGGLADIGEVTRSQILFAWPDNIFRGTTALALGLGLGVAVGAAARILRHELRQPTHARTDAVAGASD